MGKLDQPSAVGRPVRLGIRTNLAQFSLLVGVNALVGFGNLPCTFKDESLGRMKRRQVGIAARVVTELYVEIDPGIAETFARFLEITARFRGQKSCPSPRTSCMSGVRSR